MFPMSSEFDPIPDVQLRKLAGAKVYARGQAYHLEGRVVLASVEPTRVVGHVLGSEVYRGELRRRGEKVEATCECRAFEDWGFCKHLVAIALAAAETGAGDRAAALRAHLVARGAESLADLVLEIMCHAPDLRRRVEDELADATDGDEILAARIRREIAAATEVDDVVAYAGALSIAEEIDSIRARLERLAGNGRISLASVLASELVDRLADVVEAADDSEGEIHAVGCRIISLHARLLATSSCDPIALANDLLERAISGSTDLFSDAIDDYAEALGATGLDELRRLAQEAWTRLPPPARRGVGDGRRSTLRGILDRLAISNGDIDARIALRKAELVLPSAYVEIADICLEAGREAEALRWLEEGLWCFEDAPDERLATKAAHLMSRAGRTAEAAALHWRSFERAPGYHAYLRLRELPDSAAATERALDLLRTRAARSKGPGHWNADARDLLEVLMLERRFDEAWDCVHDFGIDDIRQEHLIEATAESHQAQAVAACERMAEASIRGGAPYDTAIRHVVRRGEIVGDPADQARYLVALRERHKARRTLIPKLASLSAALPTA